MPAEDDIPNGERERLAVARLYGYMKDMREWELRCASRDELVDGGELTDEESAEAMRREYADISAKYCLADRSKKKSGSSYGVPPYHHPEEESVEEVVLLPDGAVEVRTQQQFQFKHQMVYRLVGTGGEWRLAKKFRVGLGGALREEST